MKHYCAIILLFLFVVSCKHANDAPPASYPETAVGLLKNGVYIVQDSVALAKQWDNALHKAGENYNLQNFKIHATITKGAVKKQCFLLTATTNDKKVKAAAVLLKKANSFYFDESNPASVLCRADCTAGCLPTAIVTANGGIQLVCTACANCIKTDVLLIF